VEGIPPVQSSETQCSEQEVAMDLQLALPLEADSHNEALLRQAWARSGLRVPYHMALQDRAYAICLRGLADAMGRKRREYRGKRHE
jgi:hypothetical protein